MPNRNYYSLAISETTADLEIYGDITSWPWLESDVSAYILSQKLHGLDVDTINVNINSYGGEVAEGLAIYNALKRHKAKVVTRCDGFACSIASVIFMAGDERVMNDASLLMIHNAWTRATGNAAELRKAAEDIDTITQASKNAYLAHINLTEEELSAYMDEEKWITPQEALEWGFATAIETFEADTVSQNARKAVFERWAGKVPAEAKAPETGDDAPAEGHVEGPPAEPADNPPDEGETVNEAAAKMAAFFMALAKN